MDIYFGFSSYFLLLYKHFPHKSPNAKIYRYIPCIFAFKNFFKKMNIHIIKLFSNYSVIGISNEGNWSFYFSNQNSKKVTQTYGKIIHFFWEKKIGCLLAQAILLFYFKNFSITDFFNLLNLTGDVNYS